MAATIEQKAELFDLFTIVLNRIQDGSLDIDDILAMFQTVKDSPNFLARLRRLLVDIS